MTVVETAALLSAIGRKRVTPAEVQADIDAGAPRELARTEAQAIRSDSYRAVLLALEGGGTGSIATAIGRSRRSVQKWAHAFCDGGIDAVQPAKREGVAPKLPWHLEDAVRSRLDAGPRPGTACARSAKATSSASSLKSSA